MSGVSAPPPVITQAGAVITGPGGGPVAPRRCDASAGRRTARRHPAPVNGAGLPVDDDGRAAV